MKAWLVKEKGELSAAIVFAETRGKAKSRALSTECCENSEYQNIEATRQPQLDKFFVDGKTEMDWFDPQDRIILVKEANFECEYIEPCLCESCSAKDYCDMYQGAMEIKRNTEALKRMLKDQEGTS